MRVLHRRREPSRTNRRFRAEIGGILSERILMSDDAIRMILMVNVAATLFMVGLIWFVQVVHYPLFARVGESEFSAYEQAHRRLIAKIVGPAMLVEGVTSVILFWYRVPGIALWSVTLGMVLLLVIWISTAFIQMPCHKALSRGFDSGIHRRLVLSNWVRTWGWSLRGLIVMLIASTAFSSSSTNGVTPTLKIGDPAPAFTAKTSDGKQISLSDYHGKRGVVLFFYPKDGTSVCTKEACAFRDSYEKFNEAGVEVIGVSSDSDESHRSFADQYHLSFPLVSDADGALRKLFSVPNTLGLIPGRVTYVIDKDGIVRLIFSALMASDEHVTQALEAVRESGSPETKAL